VIDPRTIKRIACYALIAILSVAATLLAFTPVSQPPVRADLIATMPQALSVHESATFWAHLCERQRIWEKHHPARKSLGDAECLPFLARFLNE
jgi:hypothetical protein